MDIDAYVAAHAPTWGRLEHLLRRAARPRRLSEAELDELVDLYQRTATHLSVVRTASPDPQLVERLSGLVARARSAVTATRAPAWANVARFVTVSFPAAVYRSRWWCLGAAAGSIVVAFAMGAWLAGSPELQRTLAPPEQIRQLVEHDFADYYRSAPAAAFAARVWTNNAWVTAGAISLGVLLMVPTIYLLAANALNVGVAGGYLVANGKAGLFFGLILPHGLLELTAVFVAAGIGLRLGWTVIDAGSRRRADALAVEGRVAVRVAVGLVGVLFVSGLLEAFITPSGLPTWARVGVGSAVEVGFLAYVGLLGRRAARSGELGDVDATLRGDVLPAV
ncbi:MAG: stage II sporulation protein M [Mycobacteriales bacterium]|nr:stage II sporulation protein M [Frankia sp.]